MGGAPIIIERTLDTLAGGDGARLVRYLSERAGGNPLFVAELLHTLESESLLVQTPDGWRVGDLEGVPVPIFVVQLIESLGRETLIVKSDERSAEELVETVRRIAPQGDGKQAQSHWRQG